VTRSTPVFQLSPIRAGLRRLLLVLPMLALTGCVSEQREREIGDQMAEEVNPHLPLIHDPILLGYVNDIGRQIGAVSERPDLDYRFYIIDTDVVNAFALPGGHIYFTRGLIARTRDGPEFAGVLAHEVAHIAARHGVGKLERQLRTGSLVNLLYNTILGGEPALLRENSLQLANVVWSAGHSRRDEREADRLAVKYLIRTGIDPRGILTLLETLHVEEGVMGEIGRFESLFATHPLTEDRITDVRQSIPRLEALESSSTRIGMDTFPIYRALILMAAPPLPPAPPQ